MNYSKWSIIISVTNSYNTIISKNVGKQWYIIEFCILCAPRIKLFINLKKIVVYTLFNAVSYGLNGGENVYNTINLQHNHV